MGISLCMIVKNEETILPRCLASVKDYVEEIVVVDTGSDDKTKKIAASLGARVFDFNRQTHPESFFKDDETADGQPPYSGLWALGDFSAARNFSFAQARCPWRMWLDADDVLEHAEALPAVEEQLNQRNLDAAWFRYDYATDSAGQVICKLWRERVIRASADIKWCGPIHEILSPIAAGKHYEFNLPVIKHMRDGGRGGPPIPNRNLKILWRQYLKQKEAKQYDARTLFYLGNELVCVNPQSAVTVFDDYLNISGAIEERAIARLTIGKIFEQTADFVQAYKEFSAAVIDYPAWPDGWFGLARIAYWRQDWQRCVEYTEKGLALGDPVSVLMANPLERTFRPHVHYNLALNSLGRVKEALASCEAGLRIFPEDGNLKFNRDAYRKHIAKAEQREAAAVLLREGAITKTTYDGILATIDLPPVTLAQAALPPPAAIIAPPPIATATPISFDKLHIIIWTGQAVEPWSPKTQMTKGLGGSETAVVEMAKRFAAKGHVVTVWADCPGEEGVYDSVRYRHYGAFVPGEECDLLIVSRQSGAVELDIRARARFLWVHDIHVGLPPNPRLMQQLLRFDRIFCLSQWHKAYFLSCYPSLHPSSVVVTRNGIDTALYSGPLPPKGCRMVYGSSPDRGLEVLVELMPSIRARVPEAELRVFYGFDWWIKFSQGDTATLARIDKLKAKLTSTPGIVFRGKVPQDELAREFMEAKVWAYPTWFTETHCITALQAQAAGCVPVTTKLAALAETVKHGILLEGDCTTGPYQWLFVDAVCRLLTDEAERGPIAEAGRKYALAAGDWSKVAYEWEGLFKEVLGKGVTLPRYGS